jgi:phosphoenolpyruvate synthase/pyruvate phosphate dikinase
MEAVSRASASGPQWFFSAATATPGDYPEFAQFLVEHDIDGIAPNPDTVTKTTAAILE